MEYRLSGKISEKAFYELQCFNMRKTKLIFLLVTNFFMMGVVVWNNAGDSLFYWIFTAFFLLAFNFFLPFFMGYILKIKSRKAYRSGKKLNINPRKIRITEQELQQDTVFSTMMITPDMVYKVAYNNDQVIYIYLSTNQVLILSKDWLENGRWTELINLVQAYWNPK